MNTLQILTLALGLEFGQPTVTLTFVSPVAGTAYVDARCLGSDSWQSGWVNSPCHVGTNTITMRAPCATGALLKMRVKQ